MSNTRCLIANAVLATSQVALTADAESATIDQVHVTNDITYLAAGRIEKMDVYTPPNVSDGARLPAVLIFHGGGWVKGSKSQPSFIYAAKMLAVEGYVTASIDYKLAVRADIPDANIAYVDLMAQAFPQNIKDCKSAVRFLRKNAVTYHIDPDRIAVLGSSAGGHLAALLSVTLPTDGLEPTDDGLGDVSSAVKACISYYGVYDWATWKEGTTVGGKNRLDTDEQKAIADKSSPITYVDKGDPPMLLFHGDMDTTVAYSQSVEMAAKLTEIGIPHEFITLTGRGHSTCYVPDQANNVGDHTIVIAFLKKHIGNAVKFTLPELLCTHNGAVALQ